MIKREQQQTLLQVLIQNLQNMRQWMGQLRIEDVVMYNRNGQPLIKCYMDYAFGKEPEEAGYTCVHLGNNQYALCYFFEPEADIPTDICVYGKDTKGASFSFRSIIHS